MVNIMNKQKFGICVTTLLLASSLALPAKSVGAQENYSQTASAEEQVSNTGTVGEYGMLPIYGRDVKDGTYEIEAESSSSMFRIIKAELTVKGQEMEAAVTLSGKGYLYLFMGTGAEAAEAGEKEYIGFEEDEEGMYTYILPVEALDKELDCAAYSKRKEQWYDRVILFDAASLPEDALLVELPDYELIKKALQAYKEGEDTQTEELQPTETEEPAEASDTSAEARIPFEPFEAGREDGEYAIEVSLTGGSGKASVNSPTYLIVQDGKAYARIQWSSSNYDYMIVGGEKYLNENEDGGYSIFTIPVAVMDEEMPVIADTTAMGDPHEVEYSLTFYEESIGSKNRMPQEAAKRVVAVALAIIVGGGILNHEMKKKKRA